jgi:hypothetical protein
MTAREGPPPEWEEPRDREEAGPYQRSETFRQSAYRTRHQQGWRYAETWRAVYARGFHDALRLAERELPPETWATLQDLAERYDLAGAA